LSPDCHTHAMRKEKSIAWSLFKKAVNNELSGDESVRFEKWLDASYKNRAYFQKARRFYSESEKEAYDFFSEYDPAPAYTRFAEYAQKTGNSWKTVARIAASLLIIASVSVLVFVQPFRNDPMANQGILIEPGKPKATLTLSNGTKIVMDKIDSTKVLSDLKSLIEIDSSGIKYTGGKDEPAGPPKMNVLEIPHGGEFRLTLSDGSRVWLNSETRLEYPVAFNSATREVFLTGEGYFEVSENPDKPFIVHSGNFSVKVLGTSFNFSSYADDPQHVLTLAAGSVEISDIPGITGKHFRMEPGQQFTLDRESLRTEVIKVDPEIFTAWTKGSFVFDDESLDQIFIKLGRWYDITVFFVNEEARNEKLTGTLPRFGDFGTIMSLMEQVSNARYEIEGNRVVVK